MAEKGGEEAVGEGESYLSGKGRLRGFLCVEVMLMWLLGRDIRGLKRKLAEKGGGKGDS